MFDSTISALGSVNGGATLISNAVRPEETVTATQHLSLASIVTCPTPTPTVVPTTTQPLEYTWGCPPGYICNPPMPPGCNFWAGPPSDDYVCQPSECRAATPPLIPSSWGSDSESNITTYYPPTKGYFNLNPEDFGLSFDIFLEEVVTVNSVGPNDERFAISTYTTGDWSSQASLTQSTVPTTISHKRSISDHIKRILRRRTVPSMCFNECNNALLEVIYSGKSPKLCQVGSAFELEWQSCDECCTAHGDLTQSSLKESVDERLAQFIDYCSIVAAVSESPVGPSTVVPEPEVTGSTTAPLQTVESQSPILSSSPAPSILPLSSIPAINSESALSLTSLTPLRSAPGGSTSSFISQPSLPSSVSLIPTASAISSSHPSSLASGIPSVFSSSSASEFPSGPLPSSTLALTSGLIPSPSASSTVLAPPSSSSLVAAPTSLIGSRSSASLGSLSSGTAFTVTSASVSQLVSPSSPESSRRSEIAPPETTSTVSNVTPTSTSGPDVTSSASTNWLSGKVLGAVFAYISYILLGSV